MSRRQPNPETAAAKKLKIKQIRSVIGFCKKEQAATVRGLGLRRIGHTVEVLDHPAMRGMIHKVRHIVTVVE